MSSISSFLSAFLVIYLCCPLFDSTGAILNGKSVTSPSCVVRISIRKQRNTFGATGVYVEVIKYGCIRGLVISVCSRLATVPRTQLYVVAGVTSRLNNYKGSISNIANIIRHPDWKKNYPEKHNLCIFVLKKRLKTKKCIVDTKNRLPNQVVRIYGYGANSPQNTGMQLRKLHMAKTTLAHTKECMAVYDYQHLKVPVPWNKRDYYCTRTEQSGQCWNDWGVPLIIKSNILLGVTTFGGYCGSVHNLMGIAAKGYDIFMFLNNHGYYGSNQRRLKEKGCQEKILI